MTVPKFSTFETCVNFIKVPYLTLSKPSHWWARVQLLVLLTSGSSCYRASIFGTVTKNDATRQHQRKLRRNVTVVTERLNFLDFGTLRGGIAPLVSLYPFQIQSEIRVYWVFCILRTNFRSKRVPMAKRMSCFLFSESPWFWLSMEFCIYGTCISSSCLKVWMDSPSLLQRRGN